MVLHRLCRERWAATALDGEGARLHGGRWSPRGVPVVYCSETLALAALEVLTGVHPDDAPDDLVQIRLHVPETLSIERVDRSALPPDWRDYPPPDALAEVGRAWAESGRSLVLGVPSVIVPQEWNYLVNPRCAEVQRIEVASPQPFAFDPRLLRDR